MPDEYFFLDMSARSNVPPFWANDKIHCDAPQLNKMHKEKTIQDLQPPVRTGKRHPASSL